MYARRGAFSIRKRPMATPRVASLRSSHIVLKNLWHEVRFVGK